MSRRLITAALMLLPLTACDRGTGAPATPPTNAAESATPIERPSATATAPADTFGVRQAALRLSTSDNAPSAAYFTLLAGTAPVSLIVISSPDAGKVEMHESRMEGGMMTMAPVSRIDVPANGRVELRPGGMHLMLYDVKPAARAAGRVKLVLGFADGRTLETTATTEQMAQMQAAGGGDHAAPAAHGAH
jgi:hypothetical protein